ncbi:hypothetical protein CLAFUW4_12783 [Fulvia fulva]|uniref:Uncharacterized protein n=1 Tax=Passalora fulva TaxID=5499 RepID=A0A9Q8UUY8_PASFU|nr:uncharacterized protein CLAFUR5_12650 [Fulvia fulva]KAK4611656.1 hypothetical protein CLAFUR4_12787 [Fulvia fulva]KAK4612449.1 hypothetical protein CLAFUR0_12793 [Fulvia fulva]UJO23365.1 hypothetical protein CLAFUR5_12650 [Fulvia fulva]WPV20867.1 hypothetical protein CLAFUW4_12783 [Fulvia fulva]WPV36443.1 hypothetical protein CLAFUW7_12790 [Fulvia fulva]
MASTPRNQSSSTIVVIPQISKSDGIGRWPEGSNPPPSRPAERAWQYDEEQFKKIIGGNLTESWSDRDTKTYIVDSLLVEQTRQERPAPGLSHLGPSI